MKRIKNAKKNEDYRNGNYYPLVFKIARQVAMGSGQDLGDCISAGNEGLVYALMNYKEGVGQKKQSFTQYAAYMIRFYILNDINRNGHTIRVNREQQKKLQESGRGVNITVSLNKSSVFRKNEDGTYEDVIAGDGEEILERSLIPSDESLWSSVYERLNSVFSVRDIDIFYSTFGINGYDELSGKDVARKYNISPGAITQIRNKIIRFLRRDEASREALLELVNMM